MAKLSTLKKRSGESTVIFGGPKVGKTEEAAKLAEHFKILWFDLENGIKTAASRIPIEWQENIEVIQIPDTKQNPCAIKTLLKVFTGSPCMICEEHGLCSCPLCIKKGAPQVRVCLNELNPQEWVVVTDSGTQLTDSAYNHIMAGREDYKFEWDDWLTQGQFLSMILSAAQQAPYNSVFITHEIEGENEDGSKRICPSFGTRNFAIKSAKYFSNVVYMEVKLGKYRKGADAGFNMSVIAGNRAGLKLEEGKVTLADLIRSNFERKSAKDLGMALPKMFTEVMKIEEKKEEERKEPESIKPINAVPEKHPVQVIGAIKKEEKKEEMKESVSDIAAKLAAKLRK